MQLHIVLVDPEIPQNTGNIARTCAAIGATLHIVGRPAFSFEDRYLRRAGLDYWHLVQLEHHASLEDLAGRIAPGAHAAAVEERPRFVYTSAHALKSYVDFDYGDPCYLVFGRESTGLPRDIVVANANSAVRIPTLDEVRSLNLSNAVAVIAFEIVRRFGLPERSAGSAPGRMGEDEPGKEPSTTQAGGRSHTPRVVHRMKSTGG